MPLPPAPNPPPPHDVGGRAESRQHRARGVVYDVDIPGVNGSRGPSIIGSSGENNDEGSDGNPKDSTQLYQIGQNTVYTPNQYGNGGGSRWRPDMQRREMAYV